MKKNVLFGLVSLLSALTGFSQTIYIANNNPGATGGTHVFTGQNPIGEAVLAASDGDIIYVVPSISDYYYNVLVDKAVTITGGGFNPDRPGSPVSRVTGPISVQHNNVRLSGLVIGEVDFNGTLLNIMIDKCRISALIVSGGSTIPGAIIENCLLGEDLQISPPYIHFQNSGSVTLSNNIIYSQGSAIQGLYASTIENNAFLTQYPSRPFAFVDNCGIRNNIFYYAMPFADPTFTNNQMENNLAFPADPSAFPVTDGNTSVNNLLDDPLFTNIQLASSFSFAYDLTLQSGSPAIGSGVGGTDMGIFGGDNPFDIYGTSLPIVRTVMAPNKVAQGANLNVRIQAKGN
jgi:hypothetical protein